VRKEIGEAEEGFPAGGGVGQAVVEAGIEDEGFARSVADGPKVAHGIGAKEGLSEVPDLAGENELAIKWMGNTEALAKLRPADRALGLLVEHGVRVVMEAFHVGAGEKQEGVGRTAEIEFRSTAVVGPMEITSGDGGLGALTAAQHGLGAEEYFGDAVCGVAVGTVVDEGFDRGQQLYSRMNGKLHHFRETGTRGELRRMIRGGGSGFKLKIANRGKRGGSGNRGAARIGVRFGQSCGRRLGGGAVGKGCERRAYGD